MPLTGRPIIGGVTVRRPQTRTRRPEPVESTLELAGGSLRRYSRGNRYRWSLTWVNLPEAEALIIDTALTRRGVVSFVDQDGVSYAVMVDSYDGLEAVPGTQPTRYGASADLVMQGTIR